MEQNDDTCKATRSGCRNIYNDPQGKVMKRSIKKLLAEVVEWKHHISTLALITVRDDYHPSIFLIEPNLNQVFALAGYQ
jgi:hypothetical protein